MTAPTVGLDLLATQHYDDQGRPSLLATTSGVAMAQTYNGVGQLTSQSLGTGASSRSTAMTLGDASRTAPATYLSDVLSNGFTTRTVEYGFGDSGRLLNKEFNTQLRQDLDPPSGPLPDIAKVRYNYDSRGRVSALTVDTSAGDNVPWEAFDYDDVGNVVSLTHTLGTGVVEVWDYDVDAFNEVLQRTLATTMVSESFDRDAVIGRVSRAWTVDDLPGGAVTQRDEGYGYDGAGKLWRSTEAQTTGTVTTTMWYGVDAELLRRDTSKGALNLRDYWHGSWQLENPDAGVWRTVEQALPNLTVVTPVTRNTSGTLTYQHGSRSVRWQWTEYVNDPPDPRTIGVFRATRSPVFAARSPSVLPAGPDRWC